MCGTALTIKCFYRLTVERPGGSFGRSKRVGQSFQLLPVEERVQQYREMADASLLKAQKIEDPQLRSLYVNMATAWHALAQQLEAGNPDPELFPPIPNARALQRPKRD